MLDSNFIFIIFAINVLEKHKPYAFRLFLFTQ